MTSINMTESAKLAVKTLRANKLRASLTMLGISIGTGAVIALLALGSGVQSYVTDQFTSAGSNLISVSPGQLQRNNVPGDQAFLTDGDYQAIVAATPGIVETAAAFQGAGTFTRGSRSSQAPVLGVTPSFSAIRNWGVVHGRFIDQGDNGGRMRVIVLGRDLAQDLFPNADPVGSNVKLNGALFRVIGVMEPKGTSFFSNQDAVALIPIKTAQDRTFPAQATTAGGDRLVSMVLVQSAGEEARPGIEASIRQTLRARHRLKESYADDFTITSQTELVDTFGAVVNTLTLFLGSIAAISLLVGGVGIMNIMLVSVTERTREIGLRKAIGAKRSAIMAQFLTEAVVLSVCGGFIGILVGATLVGIAQFLVDFRPIIHLNAILFAVGFSISVGLVFGWYPAHRASALNPIDALRFE